MTGRTRAAAALVSFGALLAACAAGPPAPPTVDAYDIPESVTPFRLGLEVEGSVDVGGPNDTSALSQVMSTSGLDVSARMRLDYDQAVAVAPDGGLAVEMRPRALTGRLESFVANRSLGPDDMASIGKDGKVSLVIDADGSLGDGSGGGSPLGRFDLPVLADVLTGWPCPPLPEGGAAPNTSWPVVLTTPSGAELHGTGTYTPGELAGAHVLELSATADGEVNASGIDLIAVVRTLLDGDLPDLRVAPMDVQARVHTENRCRLDADDHSLTSWAVDAEVGVTLHATGTGRYDAILDGTTMSFDVSANAASAT